MRSYYRIFLYLTILCVVIFFFSLKDDNIYYNGDIAIAPNPDAIYQDIDLYFIGANGLVEEHRHIERSSGNREIDLLNELKNGSVSTELQAPIDDSTVILSIENIMGTCYLNFDSNYLESTIWENVPNDLIVWSLVNTLTQLDAIDKVQILFDGDKITDNGRVRLDRPLKYNYSVLVEETVTYYNVLKSFMDSLKYRYFVKAYSLIDDQSKEDISLLEFINMAREYSDKIKDYEIALYQTQKLKNDTIISLRLVKNNSIEKDEFYQDWILIDEDDRIRIDFESSMSNINADFDGY